MVAFNTTEPVPCGFSVISELDAIVLIAPVSPRILRLSMSTVPAPFGVILMLIFVSSPSASKATGLPDTEPVLFRLFTVESFSWSTTFLPLTLSCFNLLSHWNPLVLGIIL